MPVLRALFAVDRDGAQSLHRLRAGGQGRKDGRRRRTRTCAPSCSRWAFSTEDEVDRALDVLAMTKGGVVG